MAKFELKPMNTLLAVGCWLLAVGCWLHNILNKSVKYTNLNSEKQEVGCFLCPNMKYL